MSKVIFINTTFFIRSSFRLMITMILLHPFGGVLYGKGRRGILLDDKLDGGSVPHGHGLAALLTGDELRQGLDDAHSLAVAVAVEAFDHLHITHFAARKHHEANHDTALNAVLQGDRWIAQVRGDEIEHGTLVAREVRHLLGHRIHLPLIGAFTHADIDI